MAWQEQAERLQYGAKLVLNSGSVSAAAAICQPGQGQERWAGEGLHQQSRGSLSTSAALAIASS